jgi:hypothetical protein
MSFKKFIDWLKKEFSRPVDDWINVDNTIYGFHFIDNEKAVTKEYKARVQYSASRHDVRIRVYSKDDQWKNHKYYYLELLPYLDSWKDLLIRYPTASELLLVIKENRGEDTDLPAPQEYIDKVMSLKEHAIQNEWYEVIDNYDSIISHFKETIEKNAG